MRGQITIPEWYTLLSITKSLSTFAALSPPDLPLHKKLKKKKKIYKKAAKTKTVESSQPLLSLPTLAVWRWELNYLPDLTHTEPDSYEIPLTGYWVHANKIFVHQYPLLSFEFNYPKSTADPETHR